ncbi:TPA: LOW QUALITY PROTEIN: hypothetical protein N0F65_010362 [Lagenidium giganteum]|uniref:Peptidase S74 domain-containing protein n=1 Tax=Lagenidium giganteum TaxID=4803 RepID=A0AAV2Z600_9STRA|nr:TPA: LOW QUALITY PROTEIN: hypothetical protein N0F65_010362 [Lagenidium giganteum]
MDSVNLSSLSGITPGLVSPSKLVMVDSNSDIGTFRNLFATNLTGTLQTANQPNITAVGTLANLNVTGNISGTLTTGNQPNITAVGTLANLSVTGNISGNQPNITAVGTLANLSGTGNISGTLTTGNQPNITAVRTLANLSVTGNISGTLTTGNQPNISAVGTLGGLSISGGGIAHTDAWRQRGFFHKFCFCNSGGACDLKTTTANDLFLGANNARKSPSNLAETLASIQLLQTISLILSPGSVAASKAMVTNANSVIQFGSGTSTTTQIKYFANTSLRDSIRMYRVDDSSPLIIGTQIDGSTSTNRTYPILNLISSIDATAQVGGVSATSADLLTINWNDKPSVGFTSQTHRLCFNIGNTQPYKSGFPHTYALATSADAFAINLANTPYSSSYGTAPITLNQGNMYIKCSSALSDGTTNFNMPLYVESSNATPVSFAFHLSNGANTTSTNAAYMGTVSNNDLRLMTNNGTKVTVTNAGRVGIDQMQFLNGSVTSTIDVSALGVAYFLKSGGLISTIGPLSSIDVSVKASNAILAGNGVYTTSDQRIKKDFVKLDDSIVNGMLKVEPVMYRYKSQTDSTPLQLGNKAQDLIKNGLPHCINYINVDDLPVEDPTVDVENVQFSVDYSKMVCLLHKVVLRQQQQIDELAKKLSP